MEDQRWFAAASGDFNPLHVDPLAARRLLVGAVVVHGMHALLWALEEHCADGGGCPQTLNASFRVPLPTERSVSLERREEDDGRIQLAISHGDAVVATMFLEPGGKTLVGLDNPLRPAAAIPRDLTPEDTAGLAGELLVAVDPVDLARAFPHAAKDLGPARVGALMALSTLVGMECPGLHSLFSGVDLRLDESPGELSWKVLRPARPPAPLRLEVAGGGVRGRITAFLRPPPVTQPSMGSVAAQVPAAEFSGQRALIVGGSRGLGELTSKIICAGGGQSTITFHTGEADARRVADEIRVWGGHCEVKQFDVTKGIESGDHTHVYYFAAPRIGRSRSGRFDAELYVTLSRVFIEAFGSLVTALHDGIAVFYPSTVFIDEMPLAYPEYVAVKAGGEALCEHFGRHFGRRFVVRRLPPLPTDQTASLIQRRTADPVPILIDIVREMQRIT